MLARVEQARERRRDDLADLNGQRPEGIGGAVDQPDIGRDVEVGHRAVVRLLAQHLDVLGAQSDLLVGLAQRGRHGVLVG